MRRIAKAIVILGIALAARAADSIPADSSRNSLLSGKYWVRQVAMVLNSAGQRDAAASLTGAITFDGKGNYTFAGQTFSNTAVSGSKLVPLTSTGAYRVGSNGVASIDTIMFPFLGNSETLFGGVGSNGIFTGSATDGIYNDLLVAIPAGTALRTNSALSGTFFVGHLDYPSGSPKPTRNSLFQVTANGQGGFGTVTVTGRDTAQNDKALSQVVTSASYNFGPDGSATITFPPPDGSSASAALFNGTKTLYVSTDGNYLVGGDPSGYDIFFGMRPLPASSTPAAVFSGVYYFAAIDGDTSDPANLFFNSEYGSINALQNLKTFWHQRTRPWAFGGDLNDFTFDSMSTLSSDGSLASYYYKTVVAADGKALMTLGQSTDYSLLVGVAAPAPVTTSGVFVSPVGILNAASFSPVTNPVSPGELLTIFGSNLANTTTTASTLPFPSSLAGVQIMINDRPAPVYAVSPGQLSLIVPYATSGAHARVQVINNGTASNTVVMDVAGCSAGIFAVPSTGSGYGAILHANFQLVTPSNPAKQGEVVLIYLTGLGAVKPAVADGVAGPTSPLSITNTNFTVRFGVVPSETAYNGLAPGAAGLYQVNVQIPKDAPTGDVYLDLLGGNCEASQVQISIVAAP